MASLHQRPRSPFWWLKFTDKKGVKRFRSTGFRTDSALETSKAKALKAEAEVGEVVVAEQAQKSDGWNWVEKTFALEIINPLSRQATIDRWRRVEVFLIQKKIHSPTHVHPDLLAEYISWRTSTPRRSGKKASRNTAIYEMRVFIRVMRHAVRRRLIQYNPLEGVKLAKTPPKVKPAMTNEEIDIIRQALPEQPAWMTIAFEIALATGCRLRETSIPLKCIDFVRGRITFPAPKGGEGKSFTIPMPTTLRPLLESLRTKKVTCEIPKMASKEFGRDFLHRKLGLKHLSFHCLRVTKVSRMLLEGVPLNFAMRLVNHSDELVHRIYQRHEVSDLEVYRDAGISGAKSDSQT